MEILLLFLAVLLSCSMILTGLVVWLLSKQTALLASKQTEVVEAVVSTHESQAKLLDKTIALLSAKSPLEFQAVQAMSGALPYTDEPAYDPSDEAEIERLTSLKEGDHGDDRISPEDEAEFLRSIGVPGYGD